MTTAGYLGMPPGQASASCYICIGLRRFEEAVAEIPAILLGEARDIATPLTLLHVEDFSPLSHITIVRLCVRAAVDVFFLSGSQRSLIAVLSGQI